MKEEIPESLVNVESLATELGNSPEKELPKKPLLEFQSPSEIIQYCPPSDQVLVGDNHIVRGATFVIGGAPGVGKSRVSVALAVAGATGVPWMGLKTHRKFKTMIIQNENGKLRLRNEFSDLPCEQLDEYVRVSPPPPFGFAFKEPEFCAQLRQAIEDFKPDVVLLDPWNAAATDDKASDYLATFKLVRSLLPSGDDAPALGIVAHTRKPKSDEQKSGRGLLNLLAGSYVLGSVPRTVFILQPATDDPEDERVIWTCCKNNDGQMGASTAWRRGDGLFEQDLDFDWKEIDEPRKPRRGIRESDLVTLFDGGKNRMERAYAVKELQSLTGTSRASCYNALKADSPFAHRIIEEDGFLIWK